MGPSLVVKGRSIVIDDFKGQQNESGFGGF